MHLKPVNQPHVAPLELKGDRPLLIGRQPGCDLCLSDARISGKHAMLVPPPARAKDPHASAAHTPSTGDWAIIDLGSRNGVRVNATRVAPSVATALREGDNVEIGPLAFRLGNIGASTVSVRTVADNRPSMAPPPGPAPLLTPQVLRALAALSEVRDLAGWPLRVASSVQQASGFAQCFVLEPDPDLGGDESVGIAASYPPLDPTTFRGPLFSRTLIRIAREKGVAVLGGETGGRTPSLVGASVGEACCVAIRVPRDGGNIAGDAAERTQTGTNPESGAGMSSDAPFLIYAQSPLPDPASQSARVELLKTIATLAGSARASLLANEQAARQRALRRDLESAREVQQRLQPPPRGEMCGCPYAVLSQPGNLVAGDMVDIFEVGNGRLAIMLGDVTGKGPAAAMLMATLQARVREALTRGATLLETMESASHDIAHRHAPLHASLWLCLWDPSSRTLHSVDAGHGFAALCAPNASPVTLESEGGVWLGVEGGSYAASAMAMPVGARLVLYSDGIAEQVGPDATQFGMEGVLRTLRESTDPAHDVTALHDALTQHAGPLPFGDDVTALSIAL